MTISVTRSRHRKACGKACYSARAWLWRAFLIQVGAVYQNSDSPTASTRSRLTAAKRR